MKYNIILIGCIAIALSLSGCKKFLDVEPKDSLSENQFFSSEAGFQQALNGVYSQLASRDLYADRLTMGFVSALAQNYALTNTQATIPLLETTKLNYTTVEVQTHVSAIWSTSYNAIAGLNKILDNTITNKSILSDNSYAIIRGESLALRALIHFDLLRLFGKEYKANLTAKAIPYKKDISENAQMPSTTEEVVNLVLADLKEAENLLITKDPIVLTDTRTRRDHLNYYGVKALEARVRIYKGDKEGAKSAALVVVNSGKYPFVTVAAAESTTNRDRLYITEQVFMLRSRNLIDYTETYFRAGTLLNTKLTRTEANFNTLYETPTSGPLAGVNTDIRFKYWIETDGGLKFPSKFWQSSSTVLFPDRLDQYVPVIRFSEMYYILAESAATVSEGISFLNVVRQNRSLAPLATTGTQAFLNAELLKEYQKEFYAEGQLFFYYKRINAATMQFNTTVLAPAKYVLPIPDTELQFNPNY